MAQLTKESQKCLEGELDVAFVGLCSGAEGDFVAADFHQVEREGSEQFVASGHLPQFDRKGDVDALVLFDVAQSELRGGVP